MMAHYTNPDSRFVAFFIGLPNDITCWQFAKHVRPADIVCNMLISSIARDNGDLSWGTAELEKEIMQKWNDLRLSG
jgi:hypothetical protein